MEKSENEEQTRVEKDEATERTRETAGNCAVCGGHHSAQSHVAGVEERITRTFNTDEIRRASGALLDISA